MSIVGKTLIGGTAYPIGSEDAGGVTAAQLQRANANMAYLRTNGIISYIPDNMYYVDLKSADAVGTCTGFTYDSKKYPLRFGIYATSTSASGAITSASIEKAITLSRSYSNLMLMVRAEGWYSRTPPLSDFVAHKERWTGLSISASVNGVSMVSDGYVTHTETVNSGNPSSTSMDTGTVPVRYWVFMLDGNFSGSATVKINFTATTSTNLWVYDWLLFGV